MKTPRGAHSQSAAPRIVSAGTSPRGVFNAVGSLPAKIGIVPQPILPIEVQPQEIRQRLDGGEKLILIDVREPSEFAQARIANAELVPMRTVPAELSRLEARTDVGTLIVFCHHGVRSLNVVNWLREQGVDACQSMAGGIDRWSLEIDPSVPRYS
jgi:rhodanese-related sulfurtransferase